MGLDMYAHFLFEAPATAVDFEVANYGELHYWRKHPNLHGWMARFFVQAMRRLLSSPSPCAAERAGDAAPR